MRLLFAAVLVVPLGLDLYMPVPQENPIAVEKIELGRRVAWGRTFPTRGVTRRASHGGTATLSDVGAGQGQFKTPTPREVFSTAPYMHDASIATLEDVVETTTRAGIPIQKDQRWAWLSERWCGRGDSNPYALASASPSRRCV